LKCPIVFIVVSTIHGYIVVCVISGLELQPGAAGFQLSNLPVLEIVSLVASLNVRILFIAMVFIDTATNINAL